MLRPAQELLSFSKKHSRRSGWGKPDILSREVYLLLKYWNKYGLDTEKDENEKMVINISM